MKEETKFDRMGKPLKEDTFFGFDQMDQQLYLSCFSTRRFIFSQVNHADHTGTGKLYTSLCQIVEGEAEFETERAVIHGKAGDIFYMPEGERYISRWSGSPRIEFIGTYFRFFSTNDLTAMISSQKVSTPLDRQFAFQKIEPLCGFAVLEEMEALLEDYHSGSQGQLMSFSRLYRLMALAFPHLQKQAFRTIHPAILPAVSYIEHYYMQNEPVSYYAALCHLSESRFYHLFQASMQRTPVEFRNHLRAHHAASFLLDSAMSVEQISEQLGFESPEYFRRIFKRYYGIAPTQYRNQQSQ